MAGTRTALPCSGLLIAPGQRRHAWCRFWCWLYRGMWTNGRIARSIQCQKKRFVALRPAAFDKANVDAADRCAKDEPQRGRRHIMGGCQRTQHEERGLAGLRRQMQAAQTLRPNMGCPEKERATTPGAQHLLCGPQRVRELPALYPQHLRRRQPQMGKRDSLRWVGRLQENNTPVCDSFQRRREHAHLTDSSLLH